MSWNIRGGGRSEAVNAMVALEPDVAVLIDCKGKNVEGIIERGAAAGYTHHLASCTDYTGILMLSAHALTKGEVHQPPVRHRWLHAVSDRWGIEIAAIYGPLPTTIRLEPTMREFWSWLVPACDFMLERKAVPCGDFNTGISGIDGPAGYSFRGSKQFRDLGGHGWRDGYRELHPRGDRCSWWHKGRGFRIDHSMLSQGLAAPNSVGYVEEVAGIRMGPGLSDAAKASAISDHAALVIDWNLP